MIKATDLRIGNSVQSDAGYIGKVVNFTENTIRLKMEWSRLKVVTFKGIEGLQVDGILLTPEILAKCGFEMSQYYADTNTFVHQKGDYSSSGTLFFKDIDDYTSIILNNNVGYLHQLQNLYYALTGEELEFKP